MCYTVFNKQGDANRKRDKMQKLTDYNVTISYNTISNNYKFHTEKEAKAFISNQKTTLTAWGITDFTITFKPQTYTLP